MPEVAKVQTVLTQVEVQKCTNTLVKAEVTFFLK